MVAFADFSHHQRDQAVSANSVQDWPPTKGEWSIMMQTGCQNAVFWILILWGLISTCSKELISVAKKKPSVRLHNLRQLKKGPELLFNPDEFNLSCSGRLFKCCFLYNAGFCCIIYCTLASGSKVQKKKKEKVEKDLANKMTARSSDLTDSVTFLTINRGFPAKLSLCCNTKRKEK